MAENLTLLKSKLGLGKLEKKIIQVTVITLLQNREQKKQMFG
jgi:hypothetical protein